MHTFDQIAAMEKNMLEEHRKDREALERLKRFLPKDGDNPKTGETVQSPDPAPLLQLDEGLAPNTIIGKVESVMIADTTRRWTIQLMLQQLKHDNFPLAAQKPESTLGLVFAKLHRRKRIKLVRRGGGRTPNVYQGILPIQEGDSDLLPKSERATQGQPGHVQ
jgi:hypothetical protein